MGPARGEIELSWPVAPTFVCADGFGGRGCGTRVGYRRAVLVAPPARRDPFWPMFSSRCIGRCVGDRGWVCSGGRGVGFAWGEDVGVAQLRGARIESFCCCSNGGATGQRIGYVMRLVRWENVTVTTQVRNRGKLQLSASAFSRAPQKRIRRSTSRIFTDMSRAHHREAPPTSSTLTVAKLDVRSASRHLKTNRLCIPAMIFGGAMPDTVKVVPRISIIWNFSGPLNSRPELHFCNALPGPGLNSAQETVHDGSQRHHEANLPQPTSMASISSLAFSVTEDARRHPPANPLVRHRNSPPP